MAPKRSHPNGPATLLFPHFDTLIFVLRSGLIPNSIAGAEAWTWTVAGAVYVSHAVNAMESDPVLTSLGVTVVHDERPQDATHVSCWPQIVPVTRLKNPPEIGPHVPVLFEVRDARQWPALVNEILRLGNDRMMYRVISENDRHRVLLKIVGPPHYALLRAIDSGMSAGLRAFLEQTPRVWVEFGYSHPLIQSLRPAGGQCLLMRSSHEWEQIADIPFREIESAIEFASATEKRSGIDQPSVEPLDIASILASADLLEPEMWVLRDDAMDLMDEFVAKVDSRVSEQLAIAVCDNLIIVRRRPSRLPTTQFSLPGAIAFRSYSKVPNFFLPLGTRLAPPLRRATIRRLFADNSQDLVWLMPNGAIGLTRHAIADDAFQPLGSWIDLVLHRNRQVVTEWSHQSEFSFSGIVLPAEVPVEPVEEGPQKPEKTPSAPAAVIESKPPKPERPKSPAAPLAGPSTEVTEVRRRLAELEKQFLDIEGHLDHNDRRALWPALAQLNADLQQPAEAALAWTHADWESVTLSNDHMGAWLKVEKLDPIVEAADLRRLIEAGTSAADVRSLAVAVIGVGTQRALASAVVAEWTAVRSYLLSHDHLLPVRLAWLVWSAWCRVANDELELARSRDRILNRLYERGLNAETDLPTFLRFAGRADAERLRQIRDWVEEIRARIQEWIVDDLRGPHPTTTYVDLIFAFGLARLGHGSAARDLVRRVMAELSQQPDNTTEAHSFLGQAFAWRIEQIIAGRSSGGPLPGDLREYLAHMQANVKAMPHDADLARRSIAYAVERLREQSRILEPDEKLDAFRHTRIEVESLVREALALSDLQDTGQLPGRMNDVIRRAGAPGILVRVLAACVPLAGRIGSDAANKLLDQVLSALDASPATFDMQAINMRLRLIERTLFFSAHFDRPDLVQASIDRLVATFAQISAPEQLEQAGPAISQMLRSLRKLGLREQAIQLLQQLDHALTRGQSPDNIRSRDPARWPLALRALLSLASGWMFFDMADRAQPILDAARRLLLQANRSPVEAVAAKDYAPIVSNYVTALGYGSPADARARISELFSKGRLDRLPNTFNTRHFYSLFHLNIAEAVVLTLASDDFALGPVAKRWLDDDEYLIRRRIHREVREQLARGA